MAKITKVVGTLMTDVWDTLACGIKHVRARNGGKKAGKGVKSMEERPEPHSKDYGFYSVNHGEMLAQEQAMYTLSAVLGRACPGL